MKRPATIELKLSDKPALLERIRRSNLLSSDQDIFIGLIECHEWLQFSLQEKSICISKLQKIFGSSSEKRSNSVIHDANNNHNTCNSAGESKDADIHNDEISVDECNLHADIASLAEPTAIATEQKPWPTNHGRMGHDAYTGAEEITVSSGLKSGEPCPNKDCNGKLKLAEPLVVVKITGGDMAKATKYKFENFRCNVCEEYFSAEVPKHLCKDKYDAKFKSQLCVYKHVLGVPNYRLQEYQKFTGVPLPDSTQYEKMEDVANDAQSAYKHMEQLAADASLQHADDTGVTIKSLIKKPNKDKKDNVIERTGMYTTGIVAYNNGHAIHLFYSGRNHAGDNMLALLSKRDPKLPAPMYMCDALSSNMPEALKAIIINCLVHGRRNFVDIEKYFPTECYLVINIIAEVYKHDAIAREQNLSDCSRLKYHQQHSKQHMDKLYAWLNKQFDDKLVEHNGYLGKACKYMLKHWDKLTQFLKIPGAPLDNNIVERTLKMPIRMRKNSLFYATEHGACIGGILQTIIHTCIAAKQNPVAYLTALQEHKLAVKANPGAWMPWNYLANFAKTQLAA